MQTQRARPLTTADVSTADGACQMNGSRHHAHTGLRRCNTYTEQNNAHHTRRKYTTARSPVRKFRTDSVFIVKDTKETNTSLNLTRPTAARTLTQIENNTTSTGGITFTFTPLETSY